MLLLRDCCDGRCSDDSAVTQEDLGSSVADSAVDGVGRYSSSPRRQIVDYRLDAVCVSHSVSLSQSVLQQRATHAAAGGAFQINETV